MRHSVLAAAVTAVLLAACSPTPAPVVVNPGVPGGQAYVQPQDPQYQQQQPQYVPQQPVIVQAAPQPVIVQGGNGNSGAGDFVAGALVGGLVGHAIGSGGNNYGPGYGPNRTVVNNTTIVNHSTSVAAAAPAAAPVAPAQKQRIDVRAAAAQRTTAPAVRQAAPRVSVRSRR